MGQPGCATGTPGRVKTGEERHHATCDPCLLMPGDMHIFRLPDMTENSLADALSEAEGGVILTIEVSAGAKKERFPAGYNEWRRSIQCHVQAPPVEGKANRAVIRCISAATGIPKRDISLLSGATSSVKRIMVTGISRDELLARLSPDSCRDSRKNID
jgi:uncharacterized protein (TIGR00251 family)